jgi:hypothetical protein
VSAEQALEVEVSEYLRRVPQDEHGPLEYGDVLLARTLAELQAAQALREALQKISDNALATTGIPDRDKLVGIKQEADSTLAAQRTEEAGGRLLQRNPDPVEVKEIKTCSSCNMRAPWCSCGRMDYR